MTNDESMTNAPMTNDQTSRVSSLGHSSLVIDSSFGIRNSSLPIGLLAGSGRFPIIFAEKARNLGMRVVCVGIRYEASPELANLVDRFYWAGVAHLGRMIRCFQREGVASAVMAGKVTKAVMHTPWRLLTLLPDWRT